MWVIGEFGDVLLQGGTIDDGEEGTQVGVFSFKLTIPDAAQVSGGALVDLFELVLNSPYVNTLIRQFVLTAASKLSARFTQMSTPSLSTQQDRIAVILASFSSNLELEIQQRAVEFGSLFARNDLKAGVLERMPPPEIRATMMGTGMSIQWIRNLLTFSSERKEARRIHTDR